MKIVVIGVGNMGFTFAEAMAKSDFLEDKIYVYDISPEKQEELKKEKAFIVLEDLSNGVKDADIVFIAVKPYHKEDVFKEIKASVNQSQLFVSLMAGVHIKTIQKGLTIQKVVRTMPNLPAKVGKGVTSFTASKEVTNIEMLLIKKLLESTGFALQVEDENFIDKTTAISGSGPAYVYYFMESLLDAALQMDFDAEQARTLVAQTFSGAIELFNQHDYSPVEWMEKVASKGGTTSAALNHMDQSDLKNKIKDAAYAALNRAIEIGNE